MRRVCYSILIILGILLNGQCIYAKSPMVLDKGSYTSYTINLGDKVGMLSRDGSYAIPVKDITKVDKPGNYFLSYYDEKNIFYIEKFTIKPSDNRNVYIAHTQEGLIEIIKGLLESHQSKANIELAFGNWTLEGLSSLLEQSFETIIYTYPDITYDRYQFIARTGYKPTIEISIVYPDGLETFKSYSEMSDKLVVGIINQLITPLMTDYERQEAIVHYIIEHLTYDADGTSKLKHTLQGAVVDGKAVCDGYSNFTMYLLNAVGIPTSFVVGTADGIPHAWNKVKIQGDYYHMDTTWADQDSKNIGRYYNYINETDDYMKKTHIWEPMISPSAYATQYSSIYRPIKDSSIYRITDKESWQGIKKKIQVDRNDYGTAIFYNYRKYQWNEQSILSEIVQVKGHGIEYYVDYKYDSLVVTYQIAK